MERPSDIELEAARIEAANNPHGDDGHCWHSESDAAADNHDAECCLCGIRSEPTVRP